MSNHHGHREHLVKTVIFIAFATVIIIMAIVIILKQGSEKYTLSVKKVDTPAGVTINHLENSDGKYPFEQVIKGNEFLSLEDSAIYGKLIGPEIDRIQESIESELLGYYILTEWYIPIKNSIRQHDFRNMTKEQLSDIKVAIYHDSEVYIVDLDSIADFDSFRSSSGYLEYKFPFTQMAFAFFEPKRD